VKRDSRSGTGSGQMARRPTVWTPGKRGDPRRASTPFPDWPPIIRRWSPLWSCVLLAAATVLCLAPFSGRAFNIDEPPLISNGGLAHPLFGPLPFAFGPVSPERYQILRLTPRADPGRQGTVPRP
jgi:hypothetical protein